MEFLQKLRVNIVIFFFSQKKFTSQMLQKVLNTPLKEHRFFTEHLRWLLLCVPEQKKTKNKKKTRGIDCIKYTLINTSIFMVDILLYMDEYELISVYHYIKKKFFSLRISLVNMSKSPRWPKKILYYVYLRILSHFMPLTSSEAAVRSCSYRRVFWKYVADLQLNTHTEVWSQ